MDARSAFFLDARRRICNVAEQQSLRSARRNSKAAHVRGLG